MVEAQAEARTLRHGHIGTEHLLLGVLRQPDNPGAAALVARGAHLERVRARVVEHVPQGQDVSAGQMPFTPRAKKTMELALRESLASGTNQVLPEHILLGLIREPDGVAAKVLRELEVDFVGLRGAITGALPTLRDVSRRVMPAPPTADIGFFVAPSPEVRRLLMTAGAGALAGGRTEITVADLEEALRRQGGSEEPPQASTG